MSTKRCALWILHGACPEQCEDEGLRTTHSIYTVYTHMNNIKQKMGIERTTDLVRYAVENPLALGK